MKQVIVPQRHLDEIEKSRTDLYAMLEGKLDRYELSQLVTITSSMWRVSHMKYKEYVTKDCL